MDDSNPAYRLYLFTLHLWQERIGPGEMEWRGRITNTTTGATSYFRAWQGLEQLLLALVAEANAVEAPADTEQLNTRDHSDDGLMPD